MTVPFRLAAAASPAPGAAAGPGPTQRNTVERLINKVTAWRGIATRYDKTPESYRADLHLRVSMIWINGLLQATDCD
ncbi:hypothetical protein ACFVZT_33505 [Streptomyces sp. NPDC058321]|uniref:hypothetical protein n=1 Tax=Streptomyces sp. NPDC058321 TaxID=3346445 RepID=UPI0036E72AA8